MPYLTPHRRLRLPIRRLASRVPLTTPCGVCHETHARAVHCDRSRSRPSLVTSTPCTQPRRIRGPPLTEASTSLARRNHQPPTPSHPMPNQASHRCLRLPIRPLTPSLTHPTPRCQLPTCHVCSVHCHGRRSCSCLIGPTYHAETCSVH